MATRYQTQKRRIDQKLWNKLDEFLWPFISRGVVLAISGGPDSRALMEAIARWPRREEGRFLVVAIDHGVRAESPAEARFIAARAQRLGFSAHVAKLPSLTSANEQDLRERRYEVLMSLARERGLSAIATAHHGHDNAEGYFMALMGVGGGEMGSAMCEVASLGDLVLCRPFLSLGKNDLLTSLSLGGHTDFVRDSCDEARLGKRAFVRYEIFPELVRHAPNFLARLEHFGRAQLEQRDALRELAKSLIIWREGHAVVPLSPRPKTALIVSALWHILREISAGKDLRGAKAVINSIAREIAENDIIGHHEKAGLDPATHAFNVKRLDVKQYRVPGAVVFRAQNEILVRSV